MKKIKILSGLILLFAASCCFTACKSQYDKYQEYLEFQKSQSIYTDYQLDVNGYYNTYEVKIPLTSLVGLNKILLQGDTVNINIGLLNNTIPANYGIFICSDGGNDMSWNGGYNIVSSVYNLNSGNKINTDESIYETVSIYINKQASTIDYNGFKLVVRCSKEGRTDSSITAKLSVSGNLSDGNSSIINLGNPDTNYAANDVSKYTYSNDTSNFYKYYFESGNIYKIEWIDNYNKKWSRVDESTIDLNTIPSTWTLVDCQYMLLGPDFVPIFNNDDDTYKSYTCTNSGYYYIKVVSRGSGVGGAFHVYKN